ncbi:MAG: hypothetical protein AMXMBFR84_30280 [Candidatus Hydrogenedentota bacterium]
MQSRQGKTIDGEAHTMKRHLLQWMIGATLLAGMFVVRANGEITVSVTLTGSLEEIQLILEQMKALGAISGQYGEPMKMNLHSVMDSNAVQEDGVAPPPAPTLALVDPKVEPQSAKPGEEILVSISIVDTNKVVDTVAVKDSTAAEATFDLYDNGLEGDAVAGDGIWSRKTTVPAGAAAGEYTLGITAFGINGDPLATPDAVVAEGETAPPLTAEAKYAVTN